jgi:hypothetical protein
MKFTLNNIYFREFGIPVMEEMNTVIEDGFYFDEILNDAFIKEPIETTEVNIWFSKPTLKDIALGNKTQRYIKYNSSDVFEITAIDISFDDSPIFNISIIDLEPDKDGNIDIELAIADKYKSWKDFNFVSDVDVTDIVITYRPATSLYDYNITEVMSIMERYETNNIELSKIDINKKNKCVFISPLQNFRFDIYKAYIDLQDSNSHLELEFKLPVNTDFSIERVTLEYYGRCVSVDLSTSWYLVDGIKHYVINRSYIEKLKSEDK